jgi:hypothetical protein
MSEERAVALRYLEAFSRLDVEGMIAEVDDDIVLELPVAPEGFPRRVEGREAYESLLRPAMASLWSEFQLTWLEVRAEADSERVVAEYTSKGTMATTGKPYANTYVNLLRVRNGKIAETKEFFDPTALTTAADPH